MATWTDSTIFSRPNSPNAVQAVWIDSVSLAGFSAHPPFTPVDPGCALGWNSWNSAPDSSWSTLDLSAVIPPDTKAIFVQGILVVTHPSGSLDDDPDIMLGFRDYGDTVNQPYIGQANAARWTLGVREPFSCIVPITNQKCKVKWGCVDSGNANARLVTPQNYPTNSSYAINLYVQGLWR